MTTRRNSAKSASVIPSKLNSFSNCFTDQLEELRWSVVKAVLLMPRMEVAMLSVRNKVTPNNHLKSFEVKLVFSLLSTLNFLRSPLMANLRFFTDSVAQSQCFKTTAWLRKIIFHFKNDYIKITIFGYILFYLNNFHISITLLIYELKRTRSWIIKNYRNYKIFACTTITLKYYVSWTFHHNFHFFSASQITL